MTRYDDLTSEKLEEVYRAKLSMVNNIREQITEREQWIALLDGDINDLLIAMEKRKSHG